MNPTYFLYDGDDPICEFQASTYGTIAISPPSTLSAPMVYSRAPPTTRRVSPPPSTISTTHWATSRSAWMQPAASSRRTSLMPRGNRLDAANNYCEANVAYNADGELITSSTPGDPTQDALHDPYGYKGQYGYYTDHETGLICAPAGIMILPPAAGSPAIRMVTTAG